MKIRAGDRAGSTKNGYVIIRINGRGYRAHRLAWLYVYGQWPTLMIDHINGKRSDNRIENLRDVQAYVNVENQRRAQATNILGVLGVSRHFNKYRAKISIDGVCRHIGCFNTEKEAHEAYLAHKRMFHVGCSL